MRSCFTMGNKLSFLIPWQRDTEDPDTAWKSQNKEQQENLLYKYINLQKGGKLIDKYEDEGEEALIQLIEDEIRPLQYNEGKGKMVSRAEYLRWKNKGAAKMRGTPIEAEDLKTDEELLMEYVEDDFNKIEEYHECCWDFAKRGAVGETALHLLVLLDTPVTLDIAKILLSMHPKMSLDYYEGDEYYGESALHFAIVYGDFDMVRLLVECGANVNLRATGRFFLPEDIKRKPPKKKNTTDYEGYAYYGEYPLAFAASFGHEEIYDYLIDHGADPNFQDSFGNTVLHLMVITNQIGMFGYAVKHHNKKANLEITNMQRLTALTLASKLGRNEIFKEIIELQSVEIWRYSNITCAMYPLAPLDTIGIGGKTNWSSALIYITEGNSDDHLEMLDGGVIKQLLDEKWKTFARRRFFQQLALALVHLTMLSIAIYLRPSSDLLGSTDTVSLIRYTAEVFVVTYCLVIVVFQLEEIRSQGFIGFLKNQASAPAKFFFNISCLLILVCIPARLLQLEGAEMVLLSIAAPCAWFFLLFFARGLSPLGPFVIMIYQMCATDIVRFVIIFAVFLIQFSQVFYFLFKDIEDQNITTFKTIWGTLMQLIQMTFGEFKYEEFDQTRLPNLTKIIFFFFAILVPILLLNMLIAMMGNTYQQVISRSEKEWKRQWAKIIIVLERSYSRKALVRYQEEYSMKLLGSDTDAVGLMVIKTSKKTKARQRKGAISNWKRLVKEIKILLEDQKKDGKVGPLDLRSTEVNEKVKQRSKKKKQLLDVDEEGNPLDGSASAEGLMSAMAQLAWEKDIDITKGTAFVAGNTVPEEDKKPLLPGQPSKEGIDNPAFNAKTNEADSRTKPSFRGRSSSKVGPEPSSSPHSRKGSDTASSRNLDSGGTKSTLAAESDSSLNALLRETKDASNL